MLQFDLQQFIADHVTARPESMFLKDIEANRATLSARIDGKRALVIGGAGTIGSSYIKALLHFKPAALYVIDINENGLTELVRDLRSSTQYHIPPELKTYPINFGQPVFTKIIEQQGPFDIVANFAAHKHVRSEKDPYSIEAMVENNVLRAKRLLDLLRDFPPQHFFCVSTDKAANPVNVMGASKKLMEEVIMAYSRFIPITTARFANVAFSNGSLPFGFIQRLMKRQPLSSPTDVRRYFVSPEESGQICLLACMLGNSGEVFFPKLGEADMKTFSSIGTALLETLGYEADLCASEEEARRKAIAWTPDQKSYPVFYFPTDTSGEKPYEEFFTQTETVDLDRFQSLGVITDLPKRPMGEVQDMFEHLQTLFAQDELQKQEVIETLKGFIPNFAHIEKGKNLDQRM